MPAHAAAVPQACALAPGASCVGRTPSQEAAGGTFLSKPPGASRRDVAFVDLTTVSQARARRFLGAGTASRLSRTRMRAVEGFEKP